MPRRSSRTRFKTLMIPAIAMLLWFISLLIITFNLPPNSCFNPGITSTRTIYITTDCNKQNPTPSTSDLNHIFSSNHIKKDMDALSRSDKKISFVFPIGIEGSGHHGINTLFKNMRFLASYEAHADDVVSGVFKYQTVEMLFDSVLYHGMEYCWIHSFSDDKDEQHPYWNSLRKVYSDSKSYDLLSRESPCNVVQRRFNFLSYSLPNGTLLLHPGFSYPFAIDAGSSLRYPDILRLVEWTQNAKPYPFDLRFLYLRRPIKHCTLSIIRRVGIESERIRRLQMLEQTLSMIQSQLLAIDPQFWFAIDTVDLFREPIKYLDVFMRLFDGYADVEDIKLALVEPNSIKRELNTYANSELISKEMMESLDRIVDRMKVQWPLLVSDYVLVTPQNVYSTS